MNWNKASDAKKPVVRRSTVQVPVAKPAANSTRANASVPQKAPPRRPDPNRFQLSNTSVAKRRPVGNGAKPSAKAVTRRALEPARGVKRKSATPDVLFSDEDGESSDVGTTDSEASRKRAKSSVSSLESIGGSRRKIASDDAFREDCEPLPIVHGADATATAKFMNPFEHDDFSTIELLYPSRNQKERFDLKWPKSSDDYRPMTDVAETIDTIVNFYFPEELSQEYLSPSKSFTGRLSRAYQRQSISEWIEIVDEFNTVLAGLIQDGTVQRELRQQRTLALDWVQRILTQIYERTVSPKAEKLNAYKVGSSNVYGELLPRFVRDIFTKTRLNHEQVFIDLGSGVGNVVLQAALEVGCESWGIEQLPNPCELAALQANEFKARSRLWGLSTGSVNLLSGDMTTHPKVPSLLQRADVVLVNNQAFQPDLNDKLLSMFLDLKPGARVVSLKPFVPIGHKMAVRNVDAIVNQFVQVPDVYFSGCVSWSNDGNGHWYIATKDAGPLREFRRRMKLE